MKKTRSASCSIDPDSRRSDRIGRLSCRCSTARESWESAQHRDVQVAREHLQVPRDLRHLLHAVLDGSPGRHQLDVVDDDQPEVRLLRFQPSRLRADLHHRDRAGVVDVDRRLRELVAGRGEPSQSSAASLPFLSRCDSTFASLHIRRCVTSDFDISSVKSATGIPRRTAMFAAVQSARPDFPMLGRAAMMIRFPGWNPTSAGRCPGSPTGRR